MWGARRKEGVSCAATRLPPALVQNGGVRQQFDTWATLFNAMVLQAVPFLVLGVALSAMVITFVSARVWQWVLARPVGVAIPMAATCGAIVPGCECTTVPMAARLTKRGVPFSAAMSFALASPALNPIVMIATATAFAGQPSMVLARFVASFMSVLVVGSYLAASGIQPPAKSRHDHEPSGSSKAMRLVDAAQHDLLHTLGLVVVGAAAAATMRVFVPTSWLLHLSGNLAVAIPTMAILAVLLALCSESDAFVAASFVLFPPVAVLVFMVVGPLVDIRLLIMYRSVFGGKVTAAIAGFAMAAAVSSSFIIGTLLL
jgi:uncharacterized protein